MNANKLMYDGRRGLYRVYRGVFESRGVDISGWVEGQEKHNKNSDEQIAKHDKSKAGERKFELQFQEYERQHQRIKVAQDGYFARLKTLQAIRGEERARQEARREAVADRVPQPPTSGLAPDLPRSVNADHSVDGQLAQALHQMEIQEVLPKAAPSFLQPPGYRTRSNPVPVQLPPIDPSLEVPVEPAGLQLAALPEPMHSAPFAAPREGEQVVEEVDV